MALRYLGVIAAGCKASINDKFERRSTQVAHAYCDLEDLSTDVLRNCGLNIGGGLPEDLGQYLLDYDVELTQTLTRPPGGSGPECNLWTVTANYGPWSFATKGDPSKASNPLDRPPVFRIEYETRPEVITQDINGKNILNTAGIPLDPGVEFPNDITIITVERNEAASLNIPGVIALGNKINTGPWNGFDSKTVLFCKPKIPQIQYDQETSTYYWPMQYVFMVNDKNWQAKPVNASYIQQTSKLANVKNYVQIRDDNGQPLQTPGLLDANGVYQKPPVPPDQVVYLKFDIFQDIDFSVFNMDNLFAPPFAFS